MIKNIFIVLSLLTIFTGCSLKKVEKPIVRYSLENKIIKSSIKGDGVLKIERFKSPKYLDSNSIWYRTKDSLTNSYLYASWNENFSYMLMENLSTTLFHSNLFRTVFVKYSSIEPDFILEGEIVDATQIVTRNNARVEFEIRLYFIKKENSKLLGSKSFRYIQECDSVDSKGAIEAYNKIVKKLDRDVVLWLKTLVQEN